MHDSLAIFLLVIYSTPHSEPLFYKMSSDFSVNISKKNFDSVMGGNGRKGIMAPPLTQNFDNFFLSNNFVPLWISGFIDLCVCYGHIS